MTRAVLPNTSAREEWLLGSLIDRGTGHQIRAPPLNRGDDDDADTGTDTPAPDDDNEDIASFTRDYSHPDLKLVTVARALLLALLALR